MNQKQDACKRKLEADAYIDTKHISTRTHSNKTPTYELMEDNIHNSRPMLDKKGVQDKRSKAGGLVTTV